MSASRTLLILLLTQVLLPAQTPLFTARGAVDRDYVGESVARVGDLNQDGVDDWLYGAIGFDGAAGPGTGRVTAVSGSDGVVLYRVEGARSGDFLGASLTRADDLNFDGVRDWIVGSPYGGPGGSNAGVVQVRDGRTGALIREHLGAGDANGDGYGDSFGWIVAEAEDINRDGIGDYLIGAPGDYFAPPGCPAVDQPGRFEWRSGFNGQLLRTITGSPACLNAGAAIAGLGDVNGDGIPDVLLGWPEATTQSGRMEVRSGATGNVIRTHRGVGVGDFFGIWVAELGDLDADGVFDYAAGADNLNAAGQPFGAGYVLVFSGRTGTQLGRLDGRSVGDSFGRGIFDAGDQNGDGTSDFLVSAPYDDTAFFDAGRVTLFSGATFAPIREVRGEQPFDYLGFGPRAAMLPDRDGDGLGEILASTWSNDRDGTDRGIVRVFGSRLRAHHADPNLVSVANPTRVLFPIDLGPTMAFAGYGLAASLSGTGPTRLGSLTVPLTADPWLQLSLLPGTTPFANGIGFLDASGRATPFLDVPPGLPASAAGVRHLTAVVTLSPTGQLAVSAAEAFTLTR